MDGSKDKATRDAVVAKLRHGRVRMSERMSAILGYLLDEDFPGRKITSIALIGPGKVLIVGLGGEFVTLEANMVENVKGVSEVAGLSDAEAEWLLARLQSRSAASGPRW